MNALGDKGTGESLWNSYCDRRLVSSRFRKTVCLVFWDRTGREKTTTMKMILGLLKPDTGEIRVFGERVLYGQTITNRHVASCRTYPEFYGFMKPERIPQLLW